MKPLHIVLLVLAGALGGAVVMKVVEKPRPAQVPVEEVQSQPQAAPAVEPPPAEPVPAESVQAPPPEAVKPVRPPVQPRAKSAAPPRPKPSRAPHPADPVAPVMTAQNEPPPEPQAAATPSTAAPEPVPATETAAPAPDGLAASPSTPPAGSEPEPVAPPPPAPERHTVTLNAGMLIPVRLVDGLSSERNVPGDLFSATLDRELVVDGFVIAERGARVEGRVVASDKGGRVQGVAALAVALTRLHLSDGQSVSIQTDSFEKHAAATQQQDAEKVGAGVAIGAVIGAIAGGGKGAAIGAGVGGGAGAGGVLLTRGQPATLPSETRVSFRLKNPVTVTERRG